MARAAGDNTISPDAVVAFLDRYRGLEKDAEKIMGAAMKACKDGPRAGQKQIRSEAKEAGIRANVFKSLLKVREGIDSAKRAAKGLEDDDLDQFTEIVGQMQGEDTPDLFAHAATSAVDSLSEE
jgi:hypothetical protein